MSIGDWLKETLAPYVEPTNDSSSIADRLASIGLQYAPEVVDAIVERGPGTVAAVMAAKDGQTLQTFIDQVMQARQAAPPPPPPPKPAGIGLGTVALIAGGVLIGAKLLGGRR